MEGIEDKLSRFAYRDWMIDVKYGLSHLMDYLQDESSGYNSIKAIIEQKKESKEEAIQLLDSDGSLSMSLESAIFGKIKVDGVMRSADGLCSHGIMHVVDGMRAMRLDPKIKGAIVEMNTGGGEVTAAAMFRGAIKEMVDAGKPVIVYAHKAASGGIYSTVDATEIIASDEMAEFGSVGVMLSLNKELLSYVRQNVLSLYSENSPNKNRWFRDIIENEQNTKLAISELTRSDSLFMSAVKDNRPLKGTEAEINDTLSGLMFPAAEAKRRGLIDNIGTYQFAINKLKEYTNV